MVRSRTGVQDENTYYCWTPTPRWAFGPWSLDNNPKKPQPQKCDLLETKYPEVWVATGTPFQKALGREGTIYLDPFW